MGILITLSLILCVQLFLATIACYSLIQYAANDPSCALAPIGNYTVSDVNLYNLPCLLNPGNQYSVINCTQDNGITNYFQVNYANNGQLTCTSANIGNHITYTAPTGTCAIFYNNNGPSLYAKLDCSNNPVTETRSEHASYVTYTDVTCTIPTDSNTPPIYNADNAGHCTPYEFQGAIDSFQLNCTYNGVSGGIQPPNYNPANIQVSLVGYGNSACDPTASHAVAATDFGCVGPLGGGYYAKVNCYGGLLPSSTAGGGSSISSSSTGKALFVSSSPVSPSSSVFFPSSSSTTGQLQSNPSSSSSSSGSHNNPPPSLSSSSGVFVPPVSPNQVDLLNILQYTDSNCQTSAAQTGSTASPTIPRVSNGGACFNYLLLGVSYTARGFCTYQSTIGGSKPSGYNVASNPASFYLVGFNSAGCAANPSPLLTGNDLGCVALGGTGIYAKPDCYNSLGYQASANDAFTNANSPIFSFTVCLLIILYFLI